MDRVICMCVGVWVCTCECVHAPLWSLVTGRARTNMNYYHFSVGRASRGVGGRNEISSSRTPPHRRRYEGRLDNTIFCVSRFPQHRHRLYDEKSVTHTHPHTTPPHPNGIFLRKSAAPLTSHSIRVMYNASQYARDGPPQPPASPPLRPLVCPPTV